MLETVVQVLDVVHGLGQNGDFREFLYLSSSGHMLSEGLEASVDSLHSLPLPLIPLDGLEVLLRLDLVPVDWMESH